MRKTDCISEISIKKSIAIDSLIETKQTLDRVRASVTGTLLLEVGIQYWHLVFKSIRIIFLGLNREISQLENSKLIMTICKNCLYIQIAS